MNHAEAGTLVIPDGRKGYTFSDGNEFYFEHESHTQRGGDFGFGSHSTSHIEATWSHLENEIKSLYNIIPLKNFINYF